MTKVSYDILHNGKKVKNVVGYEEACNIVAELGNRFSFKPVYTEFDPDDTPERRQAAAEHRRKAAEYRKAHAK